METRRDLTEIITGKYDAERLCDALSKSWELGGRTSFEALVSLPAERRMRRRSTAQNYGISLELDGE